jgi:HopA1 effector protein family
MSNFSQTLAEIVTKIQIEPNFTVYHPDYPPLELRPDILDRLQRISPQLQSKYLIIQVQNYLHNLYFTHSSIDLQAMEIAAQQPSQIKNNSIDGVDIDFCQRLQHSNTSRGYLDRDWQVVATTDAGELIVVKDGLHLHIQPHQHLPPDFQQATIGAVVPIYLPPNLVDRDTFIIVGNDGTPPVCDPVCNSPSVQIYFNFTPDAAVAIAEKLTHQLNELSIPFQFAILHDPALFHRYDCGTLWLPQAGYLATQIFLAEIYQAHQTEFSANVPLFTKQLAPGWGLAEVPTTTVGTFGMQRCEILATGLVMAITSGTAKPNDRGQTSATDKLHSVCERFTTAGIDWLRPYLNPSARDCYSTFVV